MRWPDVAVAIIGAVEGDATLSAVFGGNVYRAGDRDLKVPALEYAVISDTETERFNPIRFQFDVFTRRDADLVVAERLLRWLFHHDLPTEIGGIKMWAQYDSRTNIEGLQDGIRGSSSDFVFTPVRSRYVRAES